MKVENLKNGDSDIPTEVKKWLGEHFVMENARLSLLSRNSFDQAQSINKMFSWKDGELQMKSFATDGTFASFQTAPPFKFGSVGELKFSNSCVINSFEWFPRTALNITFKGTDVKSLSGIHKRLEDCRVLALSRRTISGFLDILKIKEPPMSISFFSSVVYSKNKEQDKCVGILRKYLKKEKIDIFECQDELIDAGLEDLI